jgi:isoquinoline 1-oxidoreductase subunit alpha
MTTLTINGKTHSVDAPDDMPLLWVLRDIVGLTGTKFGCGIAQCGACTVQVDGAAVRSCVLPVAAVVGKKITTIEAIGETPSGRRIPAQATPTSMRRCWATSAAAARTTAFVRRSGTPRRRPDVSQGLIPKGG